MGEQGDPCSFPGFFAPAPGRPSLLCLSISPFNRRGRGGRGGKEHPYRREHNGWRAVQASANTTGGRRNPEQGPRSGVKRTRGGLSLLNYSLVVSKGGNLPASAQGSGQGGNLGRLSSTRGLDGGPSLGQLGHCQTVFLQPVSRDWTNTEHTTWIPGAL